ncbi:MAG: terminase family protein [Ferruginibacter sp.]
MAKESIIRLKKPHVNQQKVLDSAARFIVLMCGRRWGKSVISQTIGVKDALQGKQVAYVTPNYKLAKKFFKEYEKIIPESVATFNKTDLTIEFITGGLIQFFTGEAIDNFRGLSFDLVIIDEASYVPNLKAGWSASIRPTLTDRKGKAIFLSTPRGKNDFYKFSLNEHTKDDWKTFKFTSYDNPHIPPEEIDAAGEELPKATFEQEYLANAMENADNPFGYEYIKKNIRPLSIKPPKVFGIDLAKSYDYTVITGLDEDCNVCVHNRFQLPWAETVKRILALPDIPTLIDSTGVGDPIVEGVQAIRQHTEGLKFTSGSKQDLVTGLVSAVQQSKIFYPEGVYTSEMEIFEYIMTRTGVKYSAPDGMHDDAVISLALARKHWVTHGTGAIYVLR